MSSQHKIHTKPRWIIGFAVAGIAALLLLAYSTATLFDKPQTPSTIQVPQSTSNTAAPEEDHYGLPRRLQIPKIGVDAEVQYVGLTDEGNMEAPKGPADVGWYKHGPRPGEKGSSVIAGHFGWMSQPSVFDKLHTLNKGDKLYILDDKGVSIAFVVQRSRIYNPQDDTTDIFAQNDGNSHLNLITCEGDWDEAQRTYTKRLVIFAEKVN